MSPARAHPFRAVISDMDGVLTRTARLHERSWEITLNAFLRGYEGQRPFSGADYRAHVDGKPRTDGVADFLASRGILLQRGHPSDGPDARTLCGVGNRKNACFLQLLEKEPVEVFDDAVSAIARWRRGQLRLAAVSSSRNCRRVLRAAGLDDRFDTVVDGLLAAELNLGGKAQILLEAARRLGVSPEEAVILEDATAGVRAGRRDGFGLVVGVARGGAGRDLFEAGAHVVTHDLARLRFLRRLPHALERLGEALPSQGDRRLAVFLDFDGTLAPIAPRPDDAHLSNDTRAMVSALARRCAVAIVSGRDREDVEARVGIEGIFYAGNHGFDIAGRGYERTLAEAEDALHEVAHAEQALRRHVGPILGVLVERKRYSVAVHYRQVEDEALVRRIEGAVDAIRAETGLRKRAGKKVFELEPAVDWDKGRAVRWLTDVLQAGASERPFVIYVGDDETDEDAFAVLAREGIGVRVGSPITTSLADYYLEDPQEVLRLLERLTSLLGDSTAPG